MLAIQRMQPTIRTSFRNVFPNSSAPESNNSVQAGALRTTCSCPARVPCWKQSAHVTSSSRSQAERLRSVQGAYAVDPLKTVQLKDKRVVLLDDVMTSGASLFAAARVLREAGAAHITGLVFARTE